MAIFKSKNFKTDFQCEKLKTTKILRQRWDLKLLVGSFFLRLYHILLVLERKTAFFFFKSSLMMFRSGKLRFYHLFSKYDRVESLS